MTDLSPAAQAVLNAYRDKSWTPDEEDNGKYYKFSHMAGIAAALRAAADQMVPVTECSKNLCDNCCERSIKQERSDIRILLRAIAGELEDAQS